MSGISMKRRLLASTIVAGAVFSAPAAYAQATTGASQPSTPTTTSNAAPMAPAASNPSCPPGSTDPSCPSVASATDSSSSNGAGEILVTGSRIPHPDLESASPVTLVSQAQIKQFGTTRIEDLLNQLPQVFADQSSTVTNGATGTAEVDLRGLGTNRTLTLVNGRRLTPGDPASSDSAADLNMIPSSMIKRVDIFTGGASSVYGADAVAGVVNFVLDTDFSGFKIDGQYSLYQHDNRLSGAVVDAINTKNYPYPHGNTADGGTVDATAIIGSGFDDNHGHVTAYFGYRKVNQITEDSRDYSACTLGKSGGHYICGGSGTAFPANIYKDSTGSYYHVSGNTFQPGELLYNYAPTNFYQRNDERYTAGFFAHDDVSDAFKPYMEFMFMDDKSTAQIAASGDFFNTTSINCDNPFLSAQELSVICSPDNVTTGADGVTRAGAYIARRNVEGGGRQDNLEHTQYRGVVGTKGDIAKGLSYDAYYQYGRVVASDHLANQISISRLNKALDVIDVDGVPTCRSGGDCVPYNIFEEGQVTQAALNYISVPTASSGTNTEQVADGSITFLGSEYGMVSPFAHSGFSANFGVEYRKETNEQNFDLEQTSGDLAGAGAAPQDISGSFNVKEAFIEVSLPLVQDKPFFQDLTLEGGYRRSHYSIGGTNNTFNTDTFKGTVQWSPIRDIKFRATYNRAVRAPNIGELFGAQIVALDGSIDPCALASGDTFNGTTVNGYTAAQCARTGLTAAEFGKVKANPANQYNGLTGGNPDLKPEIANSITAGIVFTPTFLKGFTATIDYYQIKIKGAVGSIGADNIILDCLNSDTNCGLIHRDAAGSLFRTEDGYIVDSLTNINRNSTRGVDVNVGYTQSLGSIGTAGFSLVGTYLDKLDLGNGNCVGYYGSRCGTPSPKWRHDAKISYTMPIGPMVSLGWRFYGSTKDDTPILTGSSPTPANDLRIKQYSFFDLAITVPVADKLVLHAGANNILDKMPPINSLQLGAFENGNTFPGVYDALGRYLYIGATITL